jgi:hypothetical protein
MVLKKIYTFQNKKGQLMKILYKKCFKYKELKPLISYFLSKEENFNLTNKEKRLCYDCYQKRKIDDIIRKYNVEFDKEKKGGINDFMANI